MSTDHRAGQDAARARKKAKREAREKEAAELAFKRACKTVMVPKPQLLNWLRDECLVDYDATRIVSTGHCPEELIVTYTREP